MAMLLVNATVLDGTGKAGFPADIWIDGDRIAAVEHAIHGENAERMDCTGLVVSPGFIDAHSHSDLQVLEDRCEKVNQCVTTEVVGNCGFSAFPCGSNQALLRQFANGIFRGNDTCRLPGRFAPPEFA